MRRSTGWSYSSVQALPTSPALTRSNVPAARSGGSSLSPSTPQRKIARDPSRPHRGRVFLLRAPSHPRCAQARGQLPAGQAPTSVSKAVGAHRQPAAHARPQIRLGPRRQRRKTHLASPHRVPPPFRLRVIMHSDNFRPQFILVRIICQAFFCACIKIAPGRSARARRALLF